MAKYKITNVPNKNLGPVKRGFANVEAEKGETVLTNMSKGMNNFIEMYNIGGKKHSQKGTPLDLPSPESQGEGSSFIFSDSKKMLIRDPKLLEYFGMESKKPKTFAEVSKKFVPIINDSKAILLDPTSDKITKESAERNMNNAAFMTSALKLLQEATKGFSNGIPGGTSSFFNKLSISPQEFLNITPENPGEPMQQMAYGGQTKKYMYADGGEIKWGETDPNAKIQYDYIENVLSKNQKFKDALYQQYLIDSKQKIILEKVTPHFLELIKKKNLLPKVQKKYLKITRIFKKEI